jgi:hypothetical protein
MTALLAMNSSGSDTNRLSQESLDADVLVSTLHDAITLIGIARACSVPESAEHNLARARGCLELVLRNLDLCHPHRQTIPVMRQAVETS